MDCSAPLKSIFELAYETGFTNNPTKQKFVKRYLKDQSQSSNKFFLKDLMTSIFALADSAKLQRILKL
jgi:hypothetical protein